MRGYLIADVSTPDPVVIDVDATAARILDASVGAIRGADLPTAFGALGPLRDTMCDAIRSNDSCSAFVPLGADTYIGERQILFVSSPNEPPSEVRVAISQRDASTARREDVIPIEAVVDLISHEFRSSLNGTLIWASLLEMDQAPATVAKAAAIIRDSVRTQARLIEDLIDVSRDSGRPAPIEAQTVDMAELLATSIGDLQGSLQRDVAIEIAVTDTPHAVSGDPARLERVVQHLVRNAANAMPDGGIVGIRLSRRADSMVVDVIDCGIGIDREQISLTFRPTWRPNRQRRGAGLGLSVVRAIVAQHGGCVCARSAGLSRGSSFTFTLPIQRD